MPTITIDDDELPASSGPIDRKRADAFIERQRQLGTQASGSFEDIMRQRNAAIEEARAKIDETIAQMRERHSGGGFGGVNLPLLALGAGLLQGSPPGTVSNFGQELGRGLSAMGQTIRAQRMNDVDFLSGIAGLQRAQAQLGDMPMADAAKAARERMQSAEKNQTDIEKALIKGEASGAGSTARLKEFEEWRKEPGNEGKPFSEFMVWRSKALNNDRAPSSVAEYNKAVEGGYTGSYAKWVEEKARLGAVGRETGQAQGQAGAAIPKLDAAVDEMERDIEALKNHPGIDRAVGLMSPLPNIPGGPAADFNARLDRLKGQAFIQAFESLKGAGAITEVEGKKATDAIAALSTAQSKKQFLEQLDVVRRVINRGREVLRQRAGQTPSGATTRTIQGPDGKLYKGTLVDGQWKMEPQE